MLCDHTTHHNMYHTTQQNASNISQPFPAAQVIWNGPTVERCRRPTGHNAGDTLHQEYLSCMGESSTTASCGTLLLQIKRTISNICG